MALKKVDTIIWDGDNTLWDWMRYAVPSYEAMCQVIAVYSGKSIDETAAAMKVFYSSKGTIEDEGLIQGLGGMGFFRAVGHFNEEELIDEVKTKFGQVRRENLHLYPEIEETIAKIREMGLIQILLTDAPLNQAKARLEYFNLDPAFSSINAMPIADVPRLRARQRSDLPGNTIQEFEKPHTNLEELLGMTREEIKDRVMMIGDNDPKDMGTVRRNGCRGIHAAYGAASRDFQERIKIFAPERVAARSMQLGSGAPLKAEAESRIIRVEHPREILELVRRAA